MSRYQSDFRAADMFDAGPAGYDAVFSLEPGAGDGMPQRIFAKPVEVQITGSILTYDINDPLGARASRSSRSRRNSRICAASSAKAMCATHSRVSAFPM